jgi:hypothetical protein
MLPWLRLMRLPTVFTALSNVLCGFLITRTAAPATLLTDRALWSLLLSTTGLYLGGMVLNDVFDAELDGRERPERPIPSGAISRRAAAILGGLLMTTGVLAAATVSTSALVLAVAITICVILYDAVLKATPAGPVAMASCRFLNLLLGTSAAVELSQLLQPPAAGIALGLAIYILGVTLFARNEADNPGRSLLLAGLLVVLTALGLNIWLVGRYGADSASIRGGSLGLILLGLNLCMRAAAAITQLQPRLIQRTVGLMLLSLIFLDAILTFALTGNAGLALIVMGLMLPASLLKQVVPMS